MTNEEQICKLYGERQAEAKELLAKIGRQLDMHAEMQADEPEHWGYPGDLGTVLDRLRGVSNFLTPGVG